MIRFLATLIPSAILLAAPVAFSATKTVTIDTSLIEERIVGGEEANAEDWPWMTAYVLTYEDGDSSLEVNDISYDTEAFNYGAAGEASGEIVDCGLGDTTCTEASGNLCLIERGDINFSEKADNCEAGGGLGAIIYNNEEQGNIFGTLGEDYTGTIPVVAVTQDDGLALLELVGSVATISTTNSLQQDASCGASFLGDKWVMTAAHCVEDGSFSFYKMNVGEYDLSDGAENALEIANVYIHPDYDTDAFDHDIAIVELVESVDAEAVTIAEPEVTEQYAIENSVATVAGWGGRVGYAAGEGETSDFPDILHEVDLQLLTNEECIETLNENPDVFVDDSFVTDNMLCATIPEGGKGSCQGDSGGPLVISTGSGVQQVGLVSWGIGCAQVGYPGVYTRVSNYIDWINSITGGVAIDSQLDFDVMLVGDSQTVDLTVSNNSVSAVTLSFTIADGDAISLDTSACEALEPNTSCQISVTYTPAETEELDAEISISTDITSVPTGSSSVSGIALGVSDTLGELVGETSDAVVWYSGGNSGLEWIANASEGIESGAIDDLQQSILVAEVEGEGELTFEWAVSSEENTNSEVTDEDYEVYDALFLYINGEEADFITGELDYTEYSIDLDAGTNLITWSYAKDLNTSSGQDKGFIRNISFTPVVVVEEETPTTNTSSSSGGGSLAWFSMFALTVLLFQRRRYLKL